MTPFHSRGYGNMTLRSLPLGRAARDKGIASSSRRNSAWLESALAAVARLPRGMAVTGEDIRTILGPSLPAPASPHAWGALVRTAVLRDLLEDTGKVVQMTDARSHARRTPLWRRTAK